jgi:hypothetical protein
MRGRMGRPGLMGTMARTAVIAGTATAVAGGVSNRQQQRDAQQQAGSVPPPAASPPSPDAAGDDPIAKIKELGELHAQGLLTDEEFTAAKSKLLGI